MTNASVNGADPSPLPVVANSAAGLRRRNAVDRIEEALAGAGVIVRVEAVPPGGVAAAIERAVRGEPPRLCVAGGDGTLLTAAERLAGGPVALAPLPIGTLNHFARRLGLASLASAAEAVRGGRVATVPLGIMDDRLFLNTATFGLYADLVRRRERLRRPWRKWLAAALAFVATLTRLRRMHVTLVVDGERLERETVLVWVGVGWGSFPLVHQAPDSAGPSDLEIVVLRPYRAATSLALLFRTILRLRHGQPVRDPALEVLHARQLLIHSQHRIGVTLDGEVLRCEPPILVAVQDNALRVVTPVPPSECEPTGAADEASS